MHFSPSRPTRIWKKQCSDSYGKRKKITYWYFAHSGTIVFALGFRSIDLQCTQKHSPQSCMFDVSCTDWFFSLISCEALRTHVQWFVSTLRERARVTQRDGRKNERNCSRVLLQLGSQWVDRCTLLSRQARRGAVTQTATHCSLYWSVETLCRPCPVSVVHLCCPLCRIVSTM